MGDRVSIQFVNGDRASVALFSHWDGMDFVKAATAFVKRLQSTKPVGGMSYPLDRLEPDTVILEFFRVYYRDVEGNTPVRSNYYLGRDQNEGDNADNGHWLIHLDDNGRAERGATAWDERFEQWQKENGGGE